MYACGKIFLESLIIISSGFVYRNRRIDDESLSIESDRNDFRKECIFLYTKLNIFINMRKNKNVFIFFLTDFLQFNILFEYRIPLSAPIPFPSLLLEEKRGC